MSDKEKIKKLEERLRYFEESPYVDGYNAILNQINTWNKDLQNEPTSLKYDPDSGDADMKAFDKAHKFIASIDGLYDQLEYLRSKMSPEIAESLLKKQKEQKGSEKDKSLAL